MRGGEKHANDLHRNKAARTFASQFVMTRKMMTAPRTAERVPQDCIASREQHELRE